MKWWQVSIILSCYGFFHEFRPSDPFVAQYYTTNKNVTIEQFNNDIPLYGQVTWAVLLVVLFLFTDYLRYKPIVILGAIFGAVTWSLQTWGIGLAQMQVVEVFYGSFSACEVAYYTYMYNKVEKTHYQRVTGHARAAYMLGKSMAGLFGQLLFGYNVLNLQQLHYLTVSSLYVTCIIALVLPSVSQSTYFHRKEESEEEIPKQDKKQSSLSKAFIYLKKDFVDAFTNLYIIKWSIWWAVATAIFYLSAGFVQILWKEISDKEHLTIYNGYIEFIFPFLGAASAFTIGFFTVRWDIYGDIVLAIFSLIQGFSLFFSAYCHTLIPAYVFHILNGTLYVAGITIASSEVAKYIREDSYALVFGVNTFFGLALENILSAIILRGIQPPIRTQFQIFGGIDILVGVLFTCICFWRVTTFCIGRRRKRKEEKHET